jgi:hypothetical protein
LAVFEGFPVGRFGELCWHGPPGAGRGRDVREGEDAVADVLFVLLTVVVFAAVALVLRAGERL